MRGKLVGVLAVWAFMAPNGLQAQSRSWINQCTPGALRACASVSLSTTYDQIGGGTQISIRLENLQGSRPYLNDHAGPYSLYGVDFHNIMGPERGWMADYGGYGTPSGNAGGDNWPDIYSVGVPEWGGFGDLWVETRWWAPLWGCNVPAEPVHWPNDSYYWPEGGWTCNGSFTHTFFWEGIRLEVSDATDLELQFVGFDDSPNPEVSWWTSCGTGDEWADQDCIAMAPVPEPGTLLLLGIGLLGVGGVAIRRRKKDGIEA